MHKSSKNLQSFFDSPLHDAAGSKTSNSNNSANLKPNLKKIYDMNQGPRWILLMEKTRAVKSRATVPLKFFKVNALKNLRFKYEQLTVSAL
jgi:hypothetical protein